MTRPGQAHQSLRRTFTQARQSVVQTTTTWPLHLGPSIARSAGPAAASRGFQSYQLATPVTGW